VGGQTLSRVYAIHMLLIPGAMFALIGVHLYLVIYKGISEWPVPGKPVDPKTYWSDYQRILHEDGEPFFPKAISKDAYFSLVIICLIFALAVIFGAAQLGLKADPTTPANPKPDWYLIWYFGILALIGVNPSGAAITPYVIILAPAIGFGILFLIPLANKGERHYSRRPWAVATVILAAFTTLMLILLGYQEPWKPVLLNGYQVPSVPKSVMAGLHGDALVGAKLVHAEACISCHTFNGVGGQRGPDLTTIADRLDPNELTTRILHGGGGMPAYGDVLTPTQLRQLVSFLETRTANGTTSAGGGP
jgi:ubiquinol-cytochrome c reductase cytochrome b subunit